MTEQEKFEAMFSDPSVDKTKRHGRPDQYKDLTANLLWEGWQAAIASRDPMEWQPIETAPKDGSEIDLWHKPYNGKCRRVNNVWWVSRGWRDSFAFLDPTMVFTHWMPLPPPPKE